MSNITNQNLSKNSDYSGSKPSNGNGKFSSTKFQRPKRDRKDMRCWGCRGAGHSLRECFISLTFSLGPDEVAIV